MIRIKGQKDGHVSIKERNYMISTSKGNENTCFHLVTHKHRGKCNENRKFFVIKSNGLPLTQYTVITNVICHIIL